VHELHGKPLVFKVTKLLALSKLCTVISLHCNLVLIAESYIFSHIIISKKINEIINDDHDDDD